MYLKSLHIWLRPFFERTCLASWMVLMVANTVVMGLSAELLVFGLALSFYNIFLIDQHTVSFLGLGLVATLNFPLVVWLRRYGMENLHFELHESAMNRLMEPPESWSNCILALLDDTSARSNDLVMIVRLIDEAPGPRERQDRRADAKTWLAANRHKLTDEDKDFVKQYLGYLR